MIGRIRVWYKMWLRKWRLIPGFCKECGVDVQDFIVPDQVWFIVEPHLKYGNVACYNCFSKLCEKVGLPSVWRLSEPT